MPSVIRRLFIFGVPLHHAAPKDPKIAKDAAWLAQARRQAEQARAIKLGRRHMIDRITAAERDAYVGPIDSTEREEAEQIARVLVSP